MATLEKMMGRGRKHSTPMMKLEYVRAVQEAVDLSDVDEVRATHRSVVKAGAEPQSERLGGEWRRALLKESGRTVTIVYSKNKVLQGAISARALAETQPHSMCAKVVPALRTCPNRLRLVLRLFHC